MKFRIDSPFFQFMNMFASFVGLNIVFLVTCIPIVTIGPALTALYTVTMQEAREEHGYIFSTYFKAFRSNLLQSAAAFLLYLLLGSVLLFNIVFWGNLGTIAGNAVLFFLTFVSVIAVISFLYTFPLLARYRNTLGRTLRNAFPVAMAHRKYTLALLGIQAAVIAACAWIPQAKIFMVILGFSFLAYFNSWILVRVFRDYEEDNDAAASICPE